MTRKGGGHVRRKSSEGESEFVRSSLELLGMEGGSDEEGSRRT